MEKQLSYVLKLSLKEIALRKIVVALYNEPYILASIAKFQYEPSFHCSNIWDESEYQSIGISNQREWRKTVKNKICQLPLPESLTKPMIPILKAVGSEIVKWKLIHEAYFGDSNGDFNVHVLEKLCWTTAGAVDYRKTAEELVRCDVVDIVKRFELTCLYCLENYIPVLWKELPKENKRAFCKLRVKTPDLQLFLPYILKKQSKIHDLSLRQFRNNSFEYSAVYGDKTLTEYCFLKLRQEEREASLVRVAENVIRSRNAEIGFPFKCEARREKLSDVSCYLLSLMTPEQQIRIFKELPCEVLRCFLDWPLQDIFLDIADVIWTFLPERKYKQLLHSINKSIKRSGYYFPNIFQNLFLRCPIDFRKRFVDYECQWGHFMDGNFLTFFHSEDTETIKVIFRNVDAADRMRLVSSELGLNIIYDYECRWDMVEMFLREASLSKEDKERLKHSFMVFLKKRQRIKWAREKNRRFFEYVEETDVSAQSKRSSEDETFTRVKKKSCCEKEKNSTE